MKGVIDKDLGLRKIIRQTHLLCEREASIGVHEDAGIHRLRGQITVAEVAAINEFGGLHIPSRPFLRVGTDSAERFTFYLMAQGYDRIIMGRSTFIDALQLPADFVMNTVKKVLDEWDNPENAPRTVREKGFDDPLTWTYQLLESIEARVSKRVRTG